MAQPGPEKRSIRRFLLDLPISVKFLDNGKREIAGRTRDVSARGVYMYLQNRVAVGTTLEVVLPLPTDLSNENHKWIRCKCKVVRVEETGSREHGVAAMIEEFEALDRADIAMA